MTAENKSIFELFKSKAEMVSAEVHSFQTSNEALSFILNFLEKEGLAKTGGPTAVWANCPFLNSLDKKQLSSKIQGLGFEVNSTTAGAAKIGISQMGLAIADTGTLVQDATNVEQRLVSTLPDIHIAIVSMKNIVPDLATALSRISPDKTAYMAFITGPSRTADIERVLTIGVHGPERLVIVFVDQLEE